MLPIAITSASDVRYCFNGCAWKDRPSKVLSSLLALPALPVAALLVCSSTEVVAQDRILKVKATVEGIDPRIMPFPIAGILQDAHSRQSIGPCSPVGGFTTVVCSARVPRIARDVRLILNPQGYLPYSANLLDLPAGDDSTVVDLGEIRLRRRDAPLLAASAQLEVSPGKLFRFQFPVAQSSSAPYRIVRLHIMAQSITRDDCPGPAGGLGMIDYRILTLSVVGRQSDSSLILEGLSLDRRNLDDFRSHTFGFLGLPCEGPYLSLNVPVTATIDERSSVAFRLILPATLIRSEDTTISTGSFCHFAFIFFPADSTLPPLLTVYHDHAVYPTYPTLWIGGPAIRLASTNASANHRMKLTRLRPSAFSRIDTTPCPGGLVCPRLGLQLMRGR
jgi:hypothetical protein